jgi:hypothetical protein
MIGIRRITDVLGTGTPVVSNVTGFGSLGIFPTMFAWYKPFGPDIHDPNFIIVPDIIDEKVKITTDGGATWTVNNNLTDLVTQSGALKFRWGPFTQISTIAYDPDKFGHILVGTVQAGIFRSCDYGQSWSKVAGSEIIPSVSSFYFMKNNEVGVSSYGRGLFKLALNACPPRPRPPLYKQLEEPLIYYMGVLIPLKDIHNPDVCPRCGYFFIQNGDIRSYNLNKESNEIEEVFLSGGTVVGYSYNGSPVQTAFKISNGQQMLDFKADKTLSKLMADNYRIKGLYLEGKLFKGLILAKKDLSKEQIPKQVSPGPSVHATLLTKDTSKYSAPTLQITGLGFEKDLPIEITIDGNRIEFSEKARFDDRGNFTIQIMVPLTIGAHQITVVQKNSKGVTKETTYINMPAQDYKDERNQ